MVARKRQPSTGKPARAASETSRARSVNGIARKPRARKPNLATITAALLDDIAAIFERYVIFRSEHEARVLAAQVLYTWAWLSESGYVFLSCLYVYLCGARNSGKTRALEIGRALSYRPAEYSLIRQTEAGLFRLAHERYAIFMDEIHHSLAGLDDAGIIAILNGGTIYGNAEPRVDPKTGDVIHYNIFGPKWIAGRHDKRSLGDDTLERTVIIRTLHKPYASRELGRRFYRNKFLASEVPSLRERCEQWAELTREYFGQMREPEIPYEMTDRQAEWWESLFIIADLAGPEWAKRIRDAALTLTDDPDAVSGDTRGSAEVSDIPSFDTLVSVALNRKYISVRDYKDRGKYPVIADEKYGGLDAEDYGWPGSKSGSYKQASIKSDDRSIITLRTHNFEQFWLAVQRANRDIKLPGWRDTLRELKNMQPSRLHKDGRGLYTKSRVFEDEPKQTETYVIDVTSWYENGSETPVSEKWKDWDVYRE